MAANVDRTSEHGPMDGATRYRNTDLFLISHDDLTPLAVQLESKGIHALFVTKEDDGLWYASFETKHGFAEPEANIAMMLAVIESLPEPLRSIWDSCERREFDVGYDCGTDPWSLQQPLSCDVLGRMAALGASLQWTLYAYREEDPAHRHLP